MIQVHVGPPFLSSLIKKKTKEGSVCRVVQVENMKNLQGHVLAQSNPAMSHKTTKFN